MGKHSPPPWTTPFGAPCASSGRNFLHSNNAIFRAILTSRNRLRLKRSTDITAAIPRTPRQPGVHGCGDSGADTKRCGTTTTPTGTIISTTYKPTSNGMHGILNVPTILPKHSTKTNVQHGSNNRSFTKRIDNKQHVYRPGELGCAPSRKQSGNGLPETKLLLR